MAWFVRSALTRQIFAEEKSGDSLEPYEIESQVKAAMDKFILALFPLVGKFYVTPTKYSALPEFHIFTKGKNIGIWPIYPGSPHFQYQPELDDED